MSILYTAIKSFDRDDCETLSKTFDIKQKIGKGAYGNVYEMCNKETKDCKYDLKIITYDKQSYDMSGHMDSKSRSYIKNEWIKEVKILKKLNTCQKKLTIKLVPELYDHWFCTESVDKTHFYIIMEKFDGDLDGFINKFKSVEPVKGFALQALENLRLSLRLLHTVCNVCLNDINIKNILYKQVGKYRYEFVFADTGKSTDDMTEKCKKDDEDRLIRAIQAYENTL